MAVRIRLKKMGRTHRPFYRVCAIDRHTPRDGRVLEELGTYDTSVVDTDARAILKKDRIDYWLSVGAQPSDRCAVLIKKYGTDGTHAEIQQQALLKLTEPKRVPAPGTPASLPKKPEEPAKKAEEPAAKAEEPAAKAKEPVAKAKEPVAKAKEPAPKVEEPAAKAEEPAAKVEEEAKPQEDGVKEEKDS